MDEFGMLAKDFGFRPQGKSAPMKSPGGDRRSRHSPSSATSAADGNDIFNHVFGGPPKYTSNNNSKSTSSMSDFDYDSIFKDSVSANNNEPKTKPTSSSSSSPVYDKPVYDDDVFDGLPGIKSKPVSSSSSSGRYDDNIFASMASSPPKPSQHSDHFDDLFGNFGRTEKAETSRHQGDMCPRGFDDLIPGFGSSSPASGSRWNSDPSPKSASTTKEKSNAADDPFAVLESISTPGASSPGGLFTDPLEEMSKTGKSKSTKTKPPSSASMDMFSDIDSLNGFNKKPSPSSTSNRGKGQTQTPSEEASSIGSARSEPIDNDHQPIFDTPTASRNSPSSHTETSSQTGTSPISEENNTQYGDDIWLTVSEIPLFTPVTRAPPPSRPPPPIPKQSSSPLDDLDSFVTGRNRIRNNSEHTNASRDEEIIRLEREKMRQAVERVTREARERAASEARLKSERAAVQRAQAEARERAAAEAKGRAERAAAEAKEKAASEAREKAAVAKAQAEARRRAERAAVERVTAEARERAAAEARVRAAAATAAATATATATAKAHQQKNDDDLDSFFNMGSRPNSVPKSRTNSDSASDSLSQDRRAPEGAHRPSSSAGATTSSVRKTSPTTNFGDDLSSIFGEGASAAGEFQDVEGESEERRRARIERHQRTQERAAKALAEKNQRDMQSQQEQEERHRISTTLDAEIKRWAAGKEGNLRAMLSTLQFVLWPECGWQPVSLTDLITGVSVKKAYRKATLCIHPDKVQQKGANLQQKYVAEKVFDLLKEAWNKFNSEELF